MPFDPQPMKPKLKLKVDELLSRWLTLPHTQDMIYSAMEQVKTKGYITESDAATILGDPATHSKPMYGGGAAPPVSHSPRTPKKRSNLSGSSKSQLASPVVSQQIAPSVIPQFYFPRGTPTSAEEFSATAERINAEFSRHGGSVSFSQMGEVAIAAGLSRYWRSGLFARCVPSGAELAGQRVTQQTFSALWKDLSSRNFDLPSKFVAVFSQPTAQYLTTQDLVPLLQDVVNTHPGLGFLHQAKDFHLRYIHTVIARVFYSANRSWTGHITAAELKRSAFMSSLAQLDAETDINRLTDFFSYEHFYVIYCKFWELDADHDLLISREDLVPHNNFALNPRLVDRLFSGAVTRGQCQRDGKMTYTEFVWFLISEEDKRSHTAIEYWFRCMDLDGDGRLSMYELQHFWEEQCKRLVTMGVDPFGFQDALCQMLDMVHPADPTFVTLADLKRCQMAHFFFDTFLNIHKFLDNELKDPFSTPKDEEEQSDWERYAQQEYLQLVAEESGHDSSDLEQTLNAQTNAIDLDY